MRLHVFQHLWPREWLTLRSLCGAANRFLVQQEVQEGLIALLSEDAFALTSPFWQTLRKAIVLNGSTATRLLTSAFAAMGRSKSPRGAAMASSCRGGRARLLGRCFTVAAQMGRSNVVTLALRSKADLEQRINGQSALDGAAQAGHLRVAEALLEARALAQQTAFGRWTPLMRASQGGHLQVCELLLKEDVDPDEWADRMTALDIAEAHSHQGVFALLRSKSAKRFLELPPAKQKVSWALPSCPGGQLPKPPRPAASSARHGSRGVLWGSAVLHLSTTRISIPGDEDED